MEGFLPNFSAHFVLDDAFEGSELVEDVRHLHLFLYLLVPVYEHSVLLLRSEAPTVLKAETWAPYLYVSEGDTTAVPYSSLSSSLLPHYNCIGLL